MNTQKLMINILLMFVILFSSGCIDEILLGEVTIEEERKLLEYDILIPSYIPKGYKFESATIDNNTRIQGIEETVSITYMKNYNSIHISEMFHEKETLGINESIGDILNINGHEAHIISSEPDKQSLAIIWSTGHIMISISGPLDQNDLIKIAESMK
jgi:hypothetical protein